MLVVVGKVIADAREPRMHVAAAELLGRDLFAGRGAHQRRPARKIVPCSLTMMFSSHIAGTYAPPAVHEPMTTAICAMPFADIRAWL